MLTWNNEWKNQPVGRIVKSWPGTAKVFYKHGIDFCCGGATPLSESCERKNISPDLLADELEKNIAGAPEEKNTYEGAGGLIDHIVQTYHVPLKEEMPIIGELMERVARVHGGSHPELLKMLEIYNNLREELDVHLKKEEMVLFPWIKALEAGEQADPPDGGPGNIKGPIGVMEMDHDNAGEALKKLRELSGDYELPPGACNSYRSLYYMLADMEFELFKHIHLENNVLHSMALDLETRQTESLT